MGDSQSRLLLVEALLLGAAALSTLSAPIVAIAVIVLAMGLENAVFQIEGGGGLGLTYVTGALVKVGQLFAAALTGGARFGWLPNLLLWAALVAGSSSARWPITGSTSPRSGSLRRRAGAERVVCGRRPFERTSIDSARRLPDCDSHDRAPHPPRAACLIGWPAAHSRSPLIHRYWLRTLGIEGGYVIEAVPPDDLRDFVLRLSPRGFVGANVTIPHKERVLALSKPDARARAVGAANTLWFGDGELCSTNTDVEGFISNLDASAPGWDKADEALVLGAGGASRAVLFGLLDRGIKRVHLVNRTRAGAERWRTVRRQVHVAAGSRSPSCCRARDFWSTPHRSACMASLRSTSMSESCRLAPSSPISSMCRSRRRC